MKQGHALISEDGLAIPLDKHAEIGIAMMRDVWARKLEQCLLEIDRLHSEKNEKRWKLKKRLDEAEYSLSVAQESIEHFRKHFYEARSERDKANAEAAEARAEVEKLHAELDAAFPRCPGVGGWVIVRRRHDESIEDALRKSLYDLTSNASLRDADE